MFVMMWTDEHVSQLRDLWMKGYSPDYIATEIGGFTAHAVRAKAYSIGVVNKKPETWFPERVEQLKALWAQGYSASIIADTLGLRSRSAVLGKIHRMGLSTRKNQMSKPATARRRKRRRVRSYQTNTFKGIPNIPFQKGEPFPEGTPVDPPPDERIQIADLTQTTCRWPIENPGEPDFGFCGRKCRPDQPYCTAHMEVATK